MRSSTSPVQAWSYAGHARADHSGIQMLISGFAVFDYLFRITELINKFILNLKRV